MPVKLLTEMSESTAGGNRLSFAVGWGLRKALLREEFQRRLPRRERGFRTPGCLTSEDEERETWTAESLRVSITWELGIFIRISGVEAGRKTSAVHVYIGYTIVVRDVNRVQ